MSVLIDTCIWIDYFRGTGYGEEIDYLIDEDMLVTNELVLAELTPSLLLRGENELVSLLHDIRRCPLTIDWSKIVAMQVSCLQDGINKVGIPDLIIAQNAINNGFRLFSSDKHFRLLAQILPLKFYS
jgi:predicted nucleic acid-binding protein